MVFIINSDSFKIDSDGVSSRLLNSKVILRGFPTFYSDDGNYINPINLWINYLVNVKRAKSIKSNVRAIKRYWNFLEKNNLPWNLFPQNKSLKPTYRYRNDNLLAFYWAKSISLNHHNHPQNSIGTRASMHTKSYVTSKESL